MIWYKPKTWLAPEFQAPAVWVKMAPEFPHVGLSLFSSAVNCPFTEAVRVTGIDQSAASLELSGKVLDWNTVPLLKTGVKPTVSIETFRTWIK